MLVCRSGSSELLLQGRAWGADLWEQGHGALVAGRHSTAAGGVKASRALLFLAQQKTLKDRNSNLALTSRHPARADGVPEHLGTGQSNLI